MFSNLNLYNLHRLYHVENKLYLIRFGKYVLNLLLFLRMFLLFLVNSRQAQFVNPGCLKCISGINLSPANKTCLLFHSFYTLYLLV